MLVVSLFPRLACERATSTALVPGCRSPMCLEYHVDGMEYVTAKGVQVPALGFGTARMESEAAHRRVIDAALDVGYRHFDTAQRYGSEDVLGTAVRAADIDRDEVFITTKLDDPNRAYDAVIESVEASLQALETDYVDLLLNHWPNPENRPPDEVTIDAMNELREAGLVRHLGVANHSLDDLQRVIEHSDAPIVTNQERYSLLDRERARGKRGETGGDLRRFCLEADVMYTAYSPLSQGAVVENETLGAIADRHGKTPAQIALRWLIQQPMVSAIPFSSTPAHVRENFDIFDFTLSRAEMGELFAIAEPSDAEIRGTIGC